MSAIETLAENSALDWRKYRSYAPAIIREDDGSYRSIPEITLSDASYIGSADVLFVLDIEMVDGNATVDWPCMDDDFDYDEWYKTNRDNVDAVADWILTEWDWSVQEGEEF